MQVNAVHWSTMAVLLALVAGCASTPGGGPSTPAQPQSTQPQPQAQQRRAPPDRNLSGFSVAFREGYVDGCSSGRNGGTRRDESRYKLEMDYVMGWNDGFSVCRR